MSFWTALGGIASLFGNKKPKTLSPADSLMSHAKGAILAGEETGFNPLTLLGVGNAGYQQVGGSLGSSGFIGDAIASVGSWFNEMSGQKDQELRKAQLNERAKLETAKAEDPYRSFGYSLNTPTEIHSPVAVTLPPSHGLAELPGFWRDPLGNTRMFARLPSGEETTIPKDVADRYGIAPWGSLTVGDASEFGGEIVGEAYGVTMADRIDRNLFKYPGGARPGETFFKERSARPYDPMKGITDYGKNIKRKNPKNFWSYYGAAQ